MKKAKIVIPGLGKDKILSKKIIVTKNAPASAASNKIEIPDSVDEQSEKQIQERLEQAKKPKKGITEIQEEKDLSPYKFVYWLNTNSFKIFEFNLKYELDYLEGKCHYIPRAINPEYRHEHDNKEICVEVFSIDNKDVLKRLTKILKRFLPGKKIEWMDFDANDLKNSIEITEKLTN